MIAGDAIAAAAELAPCRLPHGPNIAAGHNEDLVTLSRLTEMGRAAKFSAHSKTTGRDHLAKRTS